MTARKLCWPAVESGEDGGNAAPAAGTSERDSLAASLGPELTRLFGVRTTVRVAGRETEKAGIAAPAITVAVLHLETGDSQAPATLELLAAEADLAQLMELLFGGEGDASPHLPLLPPNSASWMALSGFLALATSRALHATGQPCSAPATIPPRPLVAGKAAARQWLAADFEGIAVCIGLRQPLQQAPATESPGHDPQLWRHRARARALDVALPVSLRIAELKLPMGEVARLGRGAVLPLERPESVEVLAAGQPFARIPASRFIPPAGGEEEIS